ncbi:hypothetical protein DFH08DRAFT_809167 [Mycena albidolilacea]|uniref:Uncharacterized protein n=1 Tax=Mycena albidolilacea TaxID=1033008 RepID=A0AAD7ERF6_9AGAR|nr:hypothetical protein DFH08DRAFT_809167 [Mycena albidolilacea]
MCRASCCHSAVWTADSDKSTKWRKKTFITFLGMYKATYIEAENRLQNTASVNTGCSDTSELTPDPCWTTRTLGHNPERALQVIQRMDIVVQRTHGRRHELHVQRLLRGVEVLPHASSSIESPVSATIDTVGMFMGSDNAGSDRGGDAGDGTRRAPALCTRSAVSYWLQPTASVDIHGGVVRKEGHGGWKGGVAGGDWGREPGCTTKHCLGFGLSSLLSFDMPSAEGIRRRCSTQKGSGAEAESIKWSPIY